MTDMAVDVSPGAQTWAMEEAETPVASATGLARGEPATLFFAALSMLLLVALIYVLIA